VVQAAASSPSIAGTAQRDHVRAMRAAVEGRVSQLVCMLIAISVLHHVFRRKFGSGETVSAMAEPLCILVCVSPGFISTTCPNRVLARRLLDGRGVGASLFA
jgi:hypothetical protein